MTASTTVFCAVWSGDADRGDLLRGHMECLRRQTMPVEVVYVFDNGDTPPEWAAGTVLASSHPLTIYQAWNVALQHCSTDYVLNLNLDDRLAPDAIETMVEFANANRAGLVAGDWSIRYSQTDTDDVKETYRSSSLPFEPSWPPPMGTTTRLGSGSGDRGTLGPATLWRRELHSDAPYPWQFGNGDPIRIIGDLAWWAIISKRLNATIVRLPLVVGNYHSHPGEQAEFRSADEHHLLSNHGVRMGWFPLDSITRETR